MEGRDNRLSRKDLSLSQINSNREERDNMDKDKNPKSYAMIKI